MKKNRRGPAVSSTRLLDLIWDALDDVESVQDRVMHDAAPGSIAMFAEGQWRLCRRIKYLMGAKGYSKNSNSVLDVTSAVGTKPTSRAGTGGALKRSERR